MLTYKNHMKDLVLPEYGRNIQNMVDFCLTIEDRAERTRCARSIVDAMAILFPSQGDQQSYRRKLWDHLAIISNFQLDVDLPFELVKPDTFEEQPSPVTEGTNIVNRRHYGHHIEAMIERAAQMEQGEERDELVLLLANHMKKLMFALNQDDVDDAKIFKDLYEMSNGTIQLHAQTTQLHEFKIIATPNGKKKHKK